MCYYLFDNECKYKSVFKNLQIFLHIFLYFMQNIFKRYNKNNFLIPKITI
jgi:hypothetical protein